VEKRWKCKKLKDAGVILLRAWLIIFSVHGALIPLPLSKGLLYIFLLRVWTHEKRFTTEVNKAKMYIITKAAENRLLDYQFCVLYIY